MSLDDLQNKIEQKLGALSISLDALKDQKRSLLENSDKVRNSINISTDKQANALRLRERQLIRQVEVVTAHQNGLLDSQIAKLLQIRGSLSATQEILHHCKPEDLEAVSSIYEGYILSLKSVSPIKLATVQMDENPISLAISNFGKVLLPDIITHQDSSVIPSKVEDYGDSEHDVLHKSIGANTIGVNVEENIKVQFPKIPSNGWLAAPHQKNNVSTSSTPIVVHRKLSRDVSSWLADLRVSQNLEETKTGSSFDLVEDYLEFASPSIKEKSRTSSFSSSIEIVPYMDQEKESCCKSGSEIYNLKSCFSSGGIESRKINSPLPISIEEFACQANEPCSSYDDCLCDGYCKDLALERSTQTSRWLMKAQMEKEKDSKKVEAPLMIKVDLPQQGIKRKFSPTEGRNEVLKHMREIMNSDPNEWLFKHEMPNKQLKVESNRFYVSYDPPSKLWLCPKSSSLVETKVKLGSEAVRFSPHSNIWLLHKLKEEKKTEKERKNNEESAVESEQDKPVFDSSVTIMDLKGALSEVSALVQKCSSSTSKSHYSHFTPGTTRPKIYSHSFNSLLQDGESDMHRKLKWLSKSQSSNPVPGHVDLISRAHSSLPESLVALAESKLDKWLLNRY